jgi:hypothetical protein
MRQDISSLSKLKSRGRPKKKKIDGDTMVSYIGQGTEMRSFAQSDRQDMMKALLTATSTICQEHRAYKNQHISSRIGSSISIEEPSIEQGSTGQKRGGKIERIRFHLIRILLRCEDAEYPADRLIMRSQEGSSDTSWMGDYKSELLTVNTRYRAPRVDLGTRQIQAPRCQKQESFVAAQVKEQYISR